MTGRNFVVALTLLVAPAPRTAEAQESPDTPGARIDAIIAEYEAAMAAYERAWNAAPEAERGEVRRRLYILPDDELIPRVLAVVDAHPATEASARGLAWVVEVSRGRAGDEAARTLVDDYLGSPHTKAVCGRFSTNYDEGEELLLRVATDSPLRELRGHALVALGSLRKDLCEIEENLHTAEGRAQYTDWYGAELVARLREADAETLLSEAEAAYREVLEQYGDVEADDQSLEEIAERDLYELLHLRIGVEAPEIVGEDLDGVEFRLSDYRGKVVVLDFWGHW